MARLQAKYDNIRVTLGDQTYQAAEGNLTLTRRPNVGRRDVIYLSRLKDLFIMPREIRNWEFEEKPPGFLCYKNLMYLVIFYE